MATRVIGKPGRLLTIVGAAEYMGVARATVYRLIEAGHLAPSLQPALRPGQQQRQRVSEAECDRYLADCGRRGRGQAVA